MDTVTLLVAIFLSGLCLGSFFSTLVWRLYAQEVFAGPSLCPHCRNPLKARDIIPLLSFWLLGGECRYCKKPINKAYPAVEVLTASVFTLIALRNASAAIIVFLMFVASILIITLLSDAKYNLIYDVIVLPATIIAALAKLALSLSTHATFTQNFFQFSHAFTDSLLGALLALAFFGLQYHITGGRALGFGDVKIGVFIGIVFGWKALAIITILAYILGTLASIALLLARRKTLKSTLPLGVFLGIAGLYILVYGTQPIESLLQL